VEQGEVLASALEEALRHVEGLRDKVVVVKVGGSTLGSQDTTSRDLVTLQRDSQRNQNEYRDDVTFRRNEEIANVQTELLKAIQAVAQAQAFDIVLPDSAVVFISNRVDITQQVIDYIKKASPAAPAKANP